MTRREEMTMEKALQYHSVRVAHHADRQAKLRAIFDAAGAAGREPTRAEKRALSDSIAHSRARQAHEQARQAHEQAMDAGRVARDPALPRLAIESSGRAERASREAEE